jgi:hypothetical protein
MGCLRGGLSSKGRAVDNQPGTRVDGYSHHNHKKRDLQVSKGDGWSMQRDGGPMQREWERSKMEARVGWQGKHHCKKMSYACMFISCIISANNNDLCLGYK